MNSPRSCRQLCIFSRTLPTCQRRFLSTCRSSDEMADAGGMRRSLAISNTDPSRSACAGRRSASRSPARASGTPASRACDAATIFSHLAQFSCRAASFWIHVHCASGVAPSRHGWRSTMCRNAAKNAICTASEPASSVAFLKLKRFFTNSPMKSGRAWARATLSGR